MIIIMSCWLNQSLDKKIIKPELFIKFESLPEGFAFKTLGVTNLEDIYGLINNHYIEDEQHIVRSSYSKDFLYWYLKYIPTGFIVGLTYKNKLIGMITVTFIDMIIYGKEIKVPYINLLCIQNKIRNLGIASLLIEEIKKRLSKINLTHALFVGMKKITKSFCTTKDYVIPINYEKLKEVGFLTEDLTPIPRMIDNPLHLLTSSDIDMVVPKLNKFMEKIKIKPHFTKDSAYHFFIPKKNIVYSFVKRNQNDEVTDFINVYKKYLYCIDQKKIISVAQLSFYFYETMTLTQLVSYLLDKLISYDIDQLVFKNISENMEINITKFSTRDELYYYFYNFDIEETNCNTLCFYPF